MGLMTSASYSCEGEEALCSPLPAVPREPGSILSIATLMVHQARPLLSSSLSTGASGLGSVCQVDIAAQDDSAEGLLVTEVFWAQEVNWKAWPCLGIHGDFGPRAEVLVLPPRLPDQFAPLALPGTYEKDWLPGLLPNYRGFPSPRSINAFQQSMQFSLILPQTGNIFSSPSYISYWASSDASASTLKQKA